MLDDYQEKLVEKLVETPKFGLFLDLGLGKSVISLTAAKRLYDNGTIHRILIIAPKKVAIGGWGTEIESWEHLKGLTYHVVAGKPTKKRIELLNDNVDIHIVNEDMIPWLVETYNKRWRWDCLILDECTSIKNPSSKRFKRIKHVGNLFKCSLLLSGTPIANGYEGLWSQLYLIDGGKRLGRNITEYRQRYFYQASYCKFKWLLRPGADKEIQKLVSDCTIWLKNSDYVSLPSLLEEVVMVELPENVKSDYKELEGTLVLMLENLWLSYLLLMVNFGIYTVFMLQDADYVNATNRAVLTNKLNQFCNSGIYDAEKNYIHMHDEKLNKLKEIVDPNENYIIVYNYQFDKDNLQKLFPHAVVPKGDIEKVIQDWNEGKIKILLLQPQSSSRGLNLQHGGHKMIFYSLNWDLETFEQMKGRLLRRGQKSDVENTYLITKGGMDEKILKALKGKAKTQREFLEFLKGEFNG